MRLLKSLSGRLAGHPPRTKAKIGASAENTALAHLQQHGLKLVTRNWRMRGGELDLVLRDGPVLAIVEVRARASDGFGGAAASVDARKQARVILATRGFLAAHPAYNALAVRFDVVAIGPGGLDWIRSAFDVDDF
jgi:putative endonuclease